MGDADVTGEEVDWVEPSQEEDAEEDEGLLMAEETAEDDDDESASKYSRGGRKNTPSKASSCSGILSRSSLKTRAQAETQIEDKKKTHKTKKKSVGEGKKKTRKQANTDNREAARKIGSEPEDDELRRQVPDRYISLSLSLPPSAALLTSLSLSVGGMLSHPQPPLFDSPSSSFLRPSRTEN